MLRINYVGTEKNNIISFTERKTKHVLVNTHPAHNAHSNKSKTRSCKCLILTSSQFFQQHLHKL